jgi:hypothetical protein
MERQLESKVALERERVVELSTTVDAERAARAAAADELEARAAEAEQATRRSAVLESENVYAHSPLVRTPRERERQRQRQRQRETLVSRRLSRHPLRWARSQCDLRAG